MIRSLCSSYRKYDCGRFTLGKFLMLLMFIGLTFLIFTDRGSALASNGLANKHIKKFDTNIGRFLRKPPRLPPRLSPGDTHKSTSNSEWLSKQSKVRDAFVHAWSGYKKFAMGYDELMPISKRGTDGLGGLGATIVDSLDTSIIMNLEDIASEAGSWIEQNLKERINTKGQVNLFETTIRVLGGLLSAYHLNGGEQSMKIKGVNNEVLLEIAKDLGDRLLTAFTASPTPIPFSDVILHDRSAHPAPGGLSSTAEVSTVQLEFNYLSELSGDPKYGLEAMKTLQHMKTLPKFEGLVPIYISPQTGQFSGENIRLGSRGDSYYEYLIKVWIQQKKNHNTEVNFLKDMYEEAIRGVHHLLVKESIPKGLVFVGELPYGSNGGFSPKMDHLVCFLPGALALGATKGISRREAGEGGSLTVEDLKNLKLAEDLAKTCYEMYAVTSTGLAPEIAYFHTESYSEGGLDGGNKSSGYIDDIIIKHNDRHNLLRPETVESLFVLHRITGDPKYREWGWKIFEAFEKHTKIESGGYTSLDDVTTIPPQKRDKMETFFLGETLKYLYLLFGNDDLLPLDKYVFNTEAHPFPVIRSSK